MSDNRKRIAIVIPLLRKGGGAEKIASWLSRELAKRSYDISVVTFWERENEHKIGGKRFNIGTLRGGVSSMLIRAFKLRKTLKEIKPELIISFTEEASAVCLLNKFMGQKTILYTAVRNNPKERGFASRFFMRVFYPLAEKVIANSFEMKSELSRVFKLKNTVVIENPCDIAQNRGQASLELSKDIQEKIKDKFVFVNVGRMIWQKGQRHLLRAFKEVASEHQKAILMIVGSGVLEKELKDYTKALGIENRVIFTGFQDSVYPFIEKSNCFVFTSLWEGFPNAIIDALSLGKPVISFDCESGPKELLDVYPSKLAKYPHFGAFGVLLRPPRVGSASTVEAILPEEKSLSEVMREALKTDCWNGRYKNSEVRVKALSPEKIMGLWSDLINGTQSSV